MAANDETRGRPRKRRKVVATDKQTCNICSASFSRRRIRKHLLAKHGISRPVTENLQNFSIDVDSEDHGNPTRNGEADMDQDWQTDDEEDNERADVVPEMVAAETGSMHEGDARPDDGDELADLLWRIGNLAKPHLLQLLQLKSQHTLSDTGFNAIWKCIYSLILRILESYEVDTGAIRTKLPTCLRNIKKFLGLDKDDFVKYVLCPKCDTRYTMDYARRSIWMNGKREYMRCSARKFYSHRQQRMVRKCNASLMKPVLSKNGNPSPTPRKTLCHQPLSDAIQRLMGTMNLVETCEHWREKFQPDPDFNDPNLVLSDVYDGKIWHDFQYHDGKAFLAEPGNLALMFNIDWFQPFKHSKYYSVGAMYFTILNLPRQLRFKPENILLAGVIDGPKEPKLTVNSCIHPVVEDLLELWDGVLLDDPNSPTGKTFVRAAVLCLAADIPAMRKCGGFLGHNAKQGCSKCTIAFPRIRPNSARADYSNLEGVRPARDPAKHIKAAKDTLNARTVGERHLKEKTTGARWSEFYHLPYLDPVRMHVVDPMHNLYLGSVSWAVSVWKDTGILNKQNLEKVQERVDELKVPATVGRIVGKIESKFSSLTADQLRTWLHVYSIYALIDLIPAVDFNVWRLFESGCRLISGKSVSIRDVNAGTTLLHMYTVAVRERYGRDAVTMNHHLHRHLADCIRDYGPIYAFWLFSFERYNGIMEHFHTNRRDVAPQFFRKFKTSQKVIEQLSSLEPNTLSLCESACSPQEGVTRGTLGQINSSDWNAFNVQSLGPGPIDCFLETKMNVLRGAAFKRNAIFDEDERTLIMEMFATVTSDRIHVWYHYDLFDECSVGGEVAIVQRHESDRSSCVAAHWVQNVLSIPTIALESKLRPGLLKALMSVKCTLPDGSQRITNVAKVEWMEDSDLVDLYGNSSSVSVWSNGSMPSNMSAYIPLCRLFKRCAFVNAKLPHPSGREGRVVVFLP